MVTATEGRYGSREHAGNIKGDLVITFTDEEEQVNRKALKCHWSQFAEKELQEWFETDSKDKANTIYLRRFVVAKGMQKEF